MDETNNHTNAPASNELNLDAGENTDSQGSSPVAPAPAGGSAPENNTTANEINTNDVIEVTEEDSLENDAPPRLEDGDDDSAVEIVDAVAFRDQQHQQATAAAAAPTGGEDSDDELRCVGTANETKLPHNRQDCLEFRYNNSNNTNSSSCCAETTLENAKFCQLCYCYVCDKPASECTDWYLGGKGFIYHDGNGGPPEDQKQSGTTEEGGTENSSLQQYKNHCNANDKGVTKNLWKNMRTAIKNGQDPSAVTGNAMASNPDDSLAQYLARYTVPAAAAASTNAMLSGMAEHMRQRQRERHRYRAHANGRGGAHQRRTAAGDGGEQNYSSIYGSVSMDAANAMDFSSTTTTSRAPRQERRRRTRPVGSNNEQRPRHSNHRDRMRTQAILEDLYS
mmetsp:Transcript_3042/g.5018  ORF Transcript_3042/g.5018 Transcript_3042/m.5018 type:complete len:393 (-) Transcript_3042:110-1288(-)